MFLAIVIVSVVLLGVILTCIVAVAPLAEEGVYPLDYRGMLASGNPLMYPNLVATSGYRWKECRFGHTTLSEVESPHPGLHEGIVRTTFEVIVGNT